MGGWRALILMSTAFLLSITDLPFTQANQIYFLYFLWRWLTNEEGVLQHKGKKDDNCLSFKWTSETLKFFGQPIAALCLTSGPTADSDSRPRVHAIGQGGIGQGELRGGWALGRQDVLNLS